MLEPLVDTSTQRTNSVVDEHYPLTITKRRFLPFEQLVEESCPELMIPYYLDSHRKDLRKTVFELEVASPHHTWT